MAQADSASTTDPSISETRRRLEAISDPWWVEVIASMNLKPMTAHRPVNRDRTGFDGWGC